MKLLRIGILGTRGIPNQYGGFEQLAEYLSNGLVQRGHDVTVYNSHTHTYQQKEWNGVKLIHCYDPEKKMGTAGQFIYDLNCILNARNKRFDVLVFLGYTSSSVWGHLYPKKTLIVSNMDGLEWKRSKYSKSVQYFLKYAEKLAVKFSDVLIADSTAIQSYLKNKYFVDSTYIAYGAEIFTNEDEQLLTPLNLTQNNYYMLLARMEPENNIEMILDGFHQSKTQKEMVVVGNISTRFGQYLVNKFMPNKKIKFTGPIYNAATIHTLKAFSAIYFHGHSVGGTNPSLLEAMASGALIAAHNNEFNKAVLKQDACYFSNADDVCRLIDCVKKGPVEKNMIQNNLKKIVNEYNWNSITDAYESLIINSHTQFNQ